jgi:hypothetical protein
MVILAAPSHRILSGQHGIRRPSGVKGIAQPKIPDGDTSHRILSGQQGIHGPAVFKEIAQPKIPDGDTCSPQPQDPFWSAWDP